MGVDREAGSLAGRIALVVGSVPFSLVLLEAGCRVARSGIDGLADWSNLARKRMSIIEDGDTSCAYVYDATLGGYALDQTVLRIEQLVPRVKPLFVVAGFTPDDIRWLELSVSWSRPEPYLPLSTAG